MVEALYQPLFLVYVQMLTCVQSLIFAHLSCRIYGHEFKAHPPTSMDV